MPKNLAPYIHEADIPKKMEIDNIIENMDKVLVSPVLNNGIKIGTIKINDVEYNLYAPNDKPTINTTFATSITPSDNIIYEWTMTGNLTINATTASVCPNYGSHFILITGSAARTLTINAITVSGNVATSLPANTQWEITVLRGRVIMTQTK